jgi:hypothetical protein
MDRREWLGMLGAGAAGFIALGGRAARADHEGHDSEAHEACLRACVKCADDCNKCYQHCLKMLEQGHSGHGRSARLTRDCAEFCTQAACLVSRGSELMGVACQACAEACNRCGDECAGFQDEEMMRDCAEACRKCEQACREMAKAEHHDHSH